MIAYDLQHIMDILSIQTKSNPRLSDLYISIIIISMLKIMPYYLEILLSISLLNFPNMVQIVNESKST